MHVHHVPHAKHIQSLKWQSSKHSRDNAVLSSAYPIYGSASEVNRSGADVHVISCHRYLVVFHPFVEQLTIFHISGLILALTSVLQVLDFHHMRLHHERHMPKMYVNYA